LDKVSRKALDIFIDVHQDTSNCFYIVPGGNTSRLFYKLLAKRIENWGNTQFILSDERLSLEIKISNSVMVEETLLKNIENDKRPELLKYNINGNQSEIEKILKAKKPNLAILGLGTDGHTASLFPGNPEIFNDAADITIKTKNDWEDFYRISLTFNYLLKAEKILFLVNGHEKSEALIECLEGNFNPLQYPAQYIFRNYVNDIHVLCDETAAKYLA
jgi:6-phosphogluconolactonase